MLSLLAPHSRVYAVLMALAVVLVMLQQASVPAAVTPQQQTHSVTEHTAEQFDSNQCAANCVSTLQHCCLYPLSSKQPLSFFAPNPTPSNKLVYFFTSRAITPQTPPPKPA